MIIFFIVKFNISLFLCSLTLDVTLPWRLMFTFCTTEELAALVFFHLMNLQHPFSVKQGSTLVTLK